MSEKPAYSAEQLVAKIKRVDRAYAKSTDVLEQCELMFERLELTMQKMKLVEYYQEQRKVHQTGLDEARRKGQQHHEGLLKAERTINKLLY